MKKCIFIFLLGILCISACGKAEQENDGGSALDNPSADQEVQEMNTEAKGPAEAKGSAEAKRSAEAKGPVGGQESVGEQPAYDGIYPWHEPYGTGIGVMPGRVVWAHNPSVVSWDGEGYWWEPEHFDEEAVRRMVSESIASLAGEEDAEAGWDVLFRSHNGGTAYQRGEKIAIKANINGSGVFDDDTSGKTSMSYTNPVLLKALLTSLVTEAGAAPGDITVYDVSRLFPDYMI